MSFKSKALNKVARTIETHCGRMRPFIYNINTFKAFELLILDAIKKFPHFDEKHFIKHEEKLMQKLQEEIFTEQDEEKIKTGRKKKKPTKFERNDRRREEMRKLERIRKLKDIRIQQNLTANNQSFKNRNIKLTLTPPRVDSDAETLIYDSSDEKSKGNSDGELSKIKRFDYERKSILPNIFFSTLC